MPNPGRSYGHWSPDALRRNTATIYCMCAHVMKGFFVDDQVISPITLAQQAQARSQAPRSQRFYYRAASLFGM